MRQARYPEITEERNFIAWRSKVSSLLRAAFGPESEHARDFTVTTAVKPEGYTLAKGPGRDLKGLFTVNRARRVGEPALREPALA